MILVIPGTNRPNSRSLILSQFVQQSLKSADIESEILNLRDLPLQELDGSQYSEDKPVEVQRALEKIKKCRGIYFVVPEYNGSMPGILKYFIDHWAFPESFESRPVAFMGIGGAFAGLRPVEHLQHVMAYRNAFMFPKRVFVHNVWSEIVETGEIKKEELKQRISAQTLGFNKFIKALESAELHANNLN